MGKEIEKFDFLRSSTLTRRGGGGGGGGGEKDTDFVAGADEAPVW